MVYRFFILTETVPKKSEETVLDIPLKNKSVIFLSLSWFYPRNLALDDWFLWAYVRFIKKYQVCLYNSVSSEFFRNSL